MRPNPDDDDGRRQRAVEPLAWIGCLVVAIAPTAMVASCAQSLDRTDWSLFAPLLYLGVFTLMVLAVRPWTFR